MLPVFGQDVVHDAQQPFDDHVDAQFLADFPHDGVLEPLAEFQRSAGVLPQSTLVARFRAAPGKQHTSVSAEDDPTDADSDVVSSSAPFHAVSPGYE